MPVYEVRPLVVEGNDQDGYTVERMSDNTSDIYIRPLQLNEAGIINELAKKHLKLARRRYAVVELDNHGEHLEVVIEETNRPLLQLARYGLPPTAWRGPLSSGFQVLWTGVVDRRFADPVMVLDFTRNPNGEERLVKEYQLDVEILVRARGYSNEGLSFPETGRSRALAVTVGPSTHPDGFEGSQADTFEFELDAWTGRAPAMLLGHGAAIIPHDGVARDFDFDWQGHPFKFGFDPVSGEPLAFDPVQMAEACLDVELYSRGLFRAGDPAQPGWHGNIPVKLIEELGVPCFIEHDEGACGVLFDALYDRGLVTDVNLYPGVLRRRRDL